MNSALNALAWQDTCVEGLAQWVETQTPSGHWLLIHKKRLGGYLVTRFGPDRMLVADTREMSADELEAQLADRAFERPKRSHTARQRDPARSNRHPRARR